MVVPPDDIMYEALDNIMSEGHQPRASCTFYELVLLSIPITSSRGIRFPVPFSASLSLSTGS